MELKGTAKEDFEEWYDHQYFIDLCEYQPCDGGACYIHTDFEQLPQSFKYGVLVDFFDSVGIILDLQPVCKYNRHKYTKLLHFIINVYSFNIDYKEKENTIIKKTRPEARTEAIKKANEIYNSI